MHAFSRFSLAALAVTMGMAMPLSAQAADDGDWGGLTVTGLIGPTMLDAKYSQRGLAGLPGSEAYDDLSMDGLGFGGGIGAQFDLGQFIVGAEGDMMLSNAAGTMELKTTTTADLDWFATARGKVGVDLGETLVYGTGGMAFANMDMWSSAGRDSQLLTGFTVGGGLEHVMTDHLSARIETLYTDFGHAGFALGAHPLVNGDQDMWTVRAGITYRFGG